VPHVVSNLIPLKASRALLPWLRPLLLISFDDDVIFHSKINNFSHHFAHFWKGFKIISVMLVYDKNFRICLKLKLFSKLFEGVPSPKLVNLSLSSIGQFCNRCNIVSLLSCSLQKRHFSFFPFPMRLRYWLVQVWPVRFPIIVRTLDLR
jgi:hypothetical protein